MELRRVQRATASISSPNEAWGNALDECVVDTPLSEVILPLILVPNVMRREEF